MSIVYKCILYIKYFCANCCGKPTLSTCLSKAVFLYSRCWQKHFWRLQNDLTSNSDSWPFGLRQLAHLLPLYSTPGSSNWGQQQVALKLWPFLAKVVKKLHLFLYSSKSCGELQPNLIKVVMSCSWILRITKHHAVFHILTAFKWDWIMDNHHNKA